MVGQLPTWLVWRNHIPVSVGSRNIDGALATASLGLVWRARLASSQARGPYGLAPAGDLAPAEEASSLLVGLVDDVPAEVFRLDLLVMAAEIVDHIAQVARILPVVLAPVLLIIVVR